MAISIRSSLMKICKDKLRDFNAGGIPFNLLVDLEYYNNRRVLITPHMGGAFSTVIVENGVPKDIGISLPDDMDKLRLCDIDPPEQGVIFIPEFRSLIAFTKEYEKRMGDMLLGISQENPIKTKDWIQLILKLNLYSMQNKSTFYKKFYLTEGKTKGLSRKEMEYIKEALVPVYIKPDVESIITNSASGVGNFVQGSIKRAVIFCDQLVVSELREGLRMDSKVYFGGYKCYKDDSHSMTCYYPKSVLFKKGFRTTTSFYKYLIDKVNSMPDDMVNEIFTEAKPIESLEFAFDTDEGGTIDNA